MSAQECSRLHQKYSDTVAVSSAIFDIIRRNATVGRFIGESHQLLSDEGSDLTPDISCLYNADRYGLVFEIKYSIGSSADEYLLKVKRYRRALGGWPTNTGKVEWTDVVLVCNAGDTPLILPVLSDLSQKQNNDKFYSSPGFSVWQWIIGSSKEYREDSMWLQRVYGSTRNDNLERLAATLGGIRIPEELLSYLRFQHAFVRDKPPVQYTIVFLVHHVLPKQPDVPSYDVELDVVYDRANSFFPGWWESAEKTKQVKRDWIKEALNQMVSLKYVTKKTPEIYQIPTILMSKKKLLDDICRRLETSQTRKVKQARPMRRRRRVGQAHGTSTLDRFIV